jgi:hypothetical protein
MSDVPGTVTFDPAAFTAQFPAFATVPADTLTSYFDMATLYLNNSPFSIVQNLTARAAMLNLITAHIAFLLGRAAGSNGDNAALVGQVASAGEGSVNVSLVSIQAKNAAFWAQSQYGMMFWQMALPYRSFRYMPAPQPYVCR